MRTTKDKMTPRLISKVRVALAYFFFCNPLVACIIWLTGGSISSKIKRQLQKAYEADRKHFNKKKVR